MKYYIAVHDAGRTGYIAGPYDKEADAIKARHKAEKLMTDKVPMAHFYRTSLAKGNVDIKTVFGKVQS